PVLLADLDLAEPARRQLGDNRRNNLAGGASDRGVVRQAVVGAPSDGLGLGFLGGGHAGQTSSRAGGSSRRPVGLAEIPDQRPESSSWRSRSARPGRSGEGGAEDSTSR